MGEHRIFGRCKGLQFRGGLFGIFSQNPGGKDVLLMPPEKLIFNGQKDRRPAEDVGEKVWKLDTGSVREDLDGLEF